LHSQAFSDPESVAPEWRHDRRDPPAADLAHLSRPGGQGAEVLRELRDEDFGSRDFSVRDPEGNLWSFGTYRGEPRQG
jgi:hypothetical protein